MLGGWEGWSTLQCLVFEITYSLSKIAANAGHVKDGLCWLQNPEINASLFAVLA